MRYLQMPKTGTTHIVRLLQHNFPMEGIEHTHESLNGPVGGLIFGSIRNPFDWYLSAWSVSRVPRLEYLSIDNGDPRYFRTWMMELEEFAPRLYTKEARKVYARDGDWFVDRFVRTENITKTLAQIVGPIDDPFDFKSNASGRKYSTDFYYDDETRDRVSRWDGEAMRYFDYG